MKTHGVISVAPYVHGFSATDGLTKGYRTQFTTVTDYLRKDRFVADLKLNLTTIVVEKYNAGMGLDRIRYMLTPGVRLEYNKLILKSSLHHECIHTIDRPEFNGSIWWNSLRFGIGSREAYNIYLRDEYRQKNNQLLNKFDAQINLGYIIPANRSLTSGQNHEYNYEAFAILRHHLGVYHNWAFSSTIEPSVWLRLNSTIDRRLTATLTAYRKGFSNFLGIYYSYNFIDEFDLDNENKLGSLGVRLLY
ncbi:hypothetical protein ACFLQV_04460 [Calditrichota bacterium]